MLQGILQWLMGSPAGLKLNDPLNSLLGTCFLYLVNIWWSFLGKLNMFLCKLFLFLKKYLINKFNYLKILSKYILKYIYYLLIIIMYLLTKRKIIFL